MAVKPTPAIERCLRRCVEDENGCWIFQGARTEGYGVLGAGSRSAGLIHAHRLTYAHFVGDVPEGLEIDHLCRNRACCNPWHLEPVTRLVNTARGLRWHLTHCKNGHEYSPENTRYRPDGVRRCVTCTRASSRRASAAHSARRKATQ
jgi:hypothetical protein